MRWLVLVLAAAALVACSSPEEDYCDALSDSSEDFADLAASAEERDPGYLTDALDLIGRMRDDAPEGLRDEWDTVYFAWSDLVDVLDETGVDEEDFDPEKRPDGVSAEDFSQIQATAAELSSARVRDAVRGIGQHAAEVCDVDLDL
jgi:hypothetical protein